MIRSGSLILITLFSSFVGVISAQDGADDEQCTGPVYKAKEVSRRVKILSVPPPDLPRESKATEVRGQVVLNVVACGNGRITNIQVVNGLPHGLTEAAIRAARKVKFRPAEKDGQIVSQRIIFEYKFPVPQ